MTTEPNFKHILLDMIKKLLSGEWSVEEFEGQYYTFFLEGVPSGSLSDDDSAFFAAVQERLDWTSRNPTSEERDHGWLTDEEYVQWLRTERELRFGSSGEAN
jgi:hypothetical protein